jgi:hypothetical protein
MRDFDLANVSLGSFTSFPLSRRVRFAPRAERLLGRPAARHERAAAEAAAICALGWVLS